MKPLAGLVAGLLFGLGLAISGMMNPQRVLGFLDLAGARAIAESAAADVLAVD